MLLHINPTRQRGKRTGSLARASGWYMTFFAAGVIPQRTGYRWRGRAGRSRLGDSRHELSPRGLNARPGSRMVPSARGVVFAGWGRFRADRLEGPDFERNPGQAAEQAGQVRLNRGDDRPMTVLDSVNRPVAGADASATRRTRQQTRRLCNRWSTRSRAVFRCIACAAALTPLPSSGVGSRLRVSARGRRFFMEDGLPGAGVVRLHHFNPVIDGRIS